MEKEDVLPKNKRLEAINIATSFGRDRGLEFGAEKTVVVMFTITCLP